MRSPATASRLASLIVRRDDEIYSADGGWFHARWHFSFDRYYDSDNMGVGDLRVFNHDTLVPGAVWPLHPHRDVEGITYVVEGTFEHADSLGNDGVLSEGGVQRMTLGAGAWHSERNHSPTESLQFIQMWIMPATRGLPPTVDQRQFTAEDRRDRLLRIVKPEGEDGDAVTVHQDAAVYVSRLDARRKVEHTFVEGRGGYLYVIRGAIEANGRSLSSGDAAKIVEAGKLELRATDLSELVLVDTLL